ncbi:hypothetical protein SAY86_024732 [Trapa natans]|uniref:Uncharacterized protein n=1 Tax=Trapa natans TaxID=22666 RepID=A0AAN7RDM8_TRANT|nr:hypothetical protein SAY86_024732 [Trapa natans]
MSTTPTTTEVTQQDYTAHSGHGSVGPVIAVLAVITILGVIAGMIGRLCSGKTIMGRGQYDFEGWMERKFSSCIDGHVGAPPRRPPPPSPPPPQPPQQQPPDNQEEVEQSGLEQRASGEDACCHDSNAIIYPENTHCYISYRPSSELDWISSPRSDSSSSSYRKQCRGGSPGEVELRPRS